MKILMVCLGNICRSPLAEGILRKKAEERNLGIEVDSCGTSGYHDGEAPDPRSVQNAEENGLDISNLISRKFTYKDFQEFKHIFVMDSSNYKNVEITSKNKEEMDKVDFILNMTYPGENRSVPDPYFGGDSGFQNVYDLLDEACENLIKKLS